jgi:hypothetical protein
MAIAELFLDTQLDDADHRRLAEELRASRLSPAQLDRIYYDELAPILHYNLRSPAGEWSGFDGAWLESEIARRGGASRLPVITTLVRIWVTRSTIDDWRRLRALAAGSG